MSPWRPSQPLSRRAFVGGSIAASAAWSLARSSGAAAHPAAGPAPQPEIRPRQDWAADLKATGPLLDEQPGDVRFVLVHHTGTPNGYAPEAVAPRLQNIFGYHTGTKGWPDVAYNFFVDAHGRIWEGRTGSLDRPVRGDATGGSQGFAQLCCFLGDHQVEPPTPAAVDAMARLLAWLAGRYEIDLFAGPTITFASRGSNRWPEGTTVTTDPIAGHRDMSQSACPGDAAYPLIRGDLLHRAQALSPAAAPTTTTTAATTAPASTTVLAAASSTTVVAAPSGGSSTTTTAGAQAPPGSGSMDDYTAPVAIGAAVLAAVGLGVAGLRRRAAAARVEPEDVGTDLNG